jgi:hypothetical protein
MNFSTGYYNSSSTNGYSCALSQYSQGEGLGYNLSYNPQKDSNNYGASVNYDHSRFRANVNHNRTDSTVRSADGSTSKYSSNSTQVGVESTLFFADGVFSIAKNNTGDGGFVIVRPTDALQDYSLKFIYNASESGLLGGAVIQTSRNQINSSKLDLRNIPDHLEVKQDTVVSEGFYKRGALMNISCEGEYVVEGFLRYEDNKPVELVSGYAVHTTDRDADPVQFFTNEEGNFIIHNLKVGTYRVKVNIKGSKEFSIKVKKTKNNIINVGTIICEVHDG